MPVNDFRAGDAPDPSAGRMAATPKRKQEHAARGRGRARRTCERRVCEQAPCDGRDARRSRSSSPDRHEVRGRQAAALVAVINNPGRYRHTPGLDRAADVDQRDQSTARTDAAAESPGPPRASLPIMRGGTTIPTRLEDRGDPTRSRLAATCHDGDGFPRGRVSRAPIGELAGPHCVSRPRSGPYVPVRPGCSSTGRIRARRSRRRDTSRPAG
jgi:hypothetical protein